MDYSKMITQIRARLNLSQEDFSRLVGVSFSTINRWENKKSIPSRKHMCILEYICAENKIIIEANKNEDI